MQEQTTSPDDLPQWDVPGWDWAPHDYAWLDAGVSVDGTSIFFIHGGRIRHQAHIPYGHYTVDDFTKLLRNRAKGLDDARVIWSADTGGGDSGFWVEGTRAPEVADLGRLTAAREQRLWNDKISYMSIRKAHPEWFTPDVQLDEHGRPR